MFILNLNIIKFVSWLEKGQKNIKNQPFFVTKIMKLQWMMLKNSRETGAGTEYENTLPQCLSKELEK